MGAYSCHDQHDGSSNDKPSDLRRGVIQLTSSGRLMSMGIDASATIGLGTGQ